MGRTRIELLSSGDIDMYDDISTPLTFSVADIRTPDKRNAHFSKTIKVPGTKGNNKRFGHIFNINSVGSFNPNLKAGCTLYIDDVPQLYGYLQLLSIDIDDKGDIVYSVCIIGNTSNIFQDLGDSELSDLDLSDFDHVLNRTNQKASWTNTHNEGYCYPLIDYGFDNDINKYSTQHLMPAVFVRTFVDKIFSANGYRYSSSFLTSTHFNNLIIPCVGDNFKYTEEQLALRRFEARRNTTQYIPTHTSSMFPASAQSQISFNSDYSDPSNAFNTSTGKWTPPATGYYNVHAECSMNTSGTISGNVLFSYLVVRLKRGASTVEVASSYCQVTSIPTVFSVSTNNILIYDTDEIDISIRTLTATYQTPTVQWQVNTSGTRFFSEISNDGLAWGDTVILSNTVPRKVKQKDFLLDLIRMFNLYLEVDKNDSKKLNIETRDDFYSSGTIVDWTYKLDNSKTFEVTPMGDLDFKRLKYSYKDEKDYYNKKYLDSYSIGYGNRDIEITNDFLTKTNETKVMFSPTPLVAGVGDDRVISKIWEVDENYIIKQKPFGIRILYNGGIKSTNNPWIWDDFFSTHTETTYLYAGHLDSVTAPTFDLSFAVPKELYYNATTYTNANLYNLYHKRYIDEITDPDSKIVTAYFHLTPSDIYKLDFRNSFYFEGQYFRLNKIYDYNPIDDSVTKCEFIKIKEGRSFTSTARGLYGGVTVPYVLGGDDDTPVVGLVGTLRSVTVLGNGNVLGNSLRNSYINGDDNYVHGGNNINLLGSSGNIIYDGLENVTLINTSGTIVSESNQLVVYGISLSSGTIASLGNQWQTGSSSSSLFKWDSVNSFSSITITTNRYIIVGKTITWAFKGLFTTSSAPTNIEIYIPSSGVCKSTHTTRGVRISAAAEESGFIACIAGNDFIDIGNDSGTALGSTTITIEFLITFEIE